MSELFELLEERRDLSRQERERRKEVEEFIEAELSDAGYPVNNVETESDHLEFDVVRDRGYADKSDLRKLDDVFPQFRVDMVQAVNYDERPRLKIFFKHNDRFDEDGDEQ